MRRIVEPELSPKISSLDLKPEIEALLYEKRYDRINQLLWVLADNHDKGFLAIEGMSEAMVKELEDTLKAAGYKVRITAPEALICEIVSEKLRAGALFYFLHRSLSSTELNALDECVSKEIHDNKVRRAVRLHYGLDGQPITFAEIGTILDEVLPITTVREGIEILCKTSYAENFTKFLKQELR